LGGVIAFGGIAALGAASFGAGAGALPEAGAASHSSTSTSTSPAVATSVSFAVDVHAHTPTQRTMHLQVEGQMNFVRDTMTATVTVPAPAMPASATTAEVDPTAKTMKLHTEWVGDHAYLSVPSQWTAQVPGAQTLSLPTSSALQQMVTTALTQSAVALTYAKLLLTDLMQQSPHRLGSRTIEGVATTGSKVQLTLPQLLKLIPQLSPSMTKNEPSMADAPIPAKVWVDRQGRLVEMDLAAAKGSAAWVTGTVRFSDYGASAKVTPPPAATVKPIPPALQRLLGHWYYF
jgi:hypothetical protein